MSKTNKLKQKTTGFDILYRVITAVLVVAMFPLAYFQKMIFIVVMHKEASTLIDKLFGAETADPGGTYFEWSISDLFNPMSSLHSIINTKDEITFNLSVFWENPYLRAVLFAVVFFALTLVIALVILGFAVFSNKTKIITILSASGVASMLASWISFSMFFAEPITSNAVSIGEVLNIGGVITNLLLGFFDITTIKLESAFFSVLFLMLGILIWSVSVYIVNKSDEKEKAMKKAEKANK